MLIEVNLKNGGNDIMFLTDSEIHCQIDQMLLEYDACKVYDVDSEIEYLIIENFGFCLIFDSNQEMFILESVQEFIDRQDPRCYLSSIQGCQVKIDVKEL